MFEGDGPVGAIVGGLIGARDGFDTGFGVCTLTSTGAAEEKGGCTLIFFGFTYDKQELPHCAIDELKKLGNDVVMSDSTLAKAALALLKPKDCSVTFIVNAMDKIGTLLGADTNEISLFEWRRWASLVAADCVLDTTVMLIAERLVPTASAILPSNINRIKLVKLDAWMPSMT